MLITSQGNSNLLRYNDTEADLAKEEGAMWASVPSPLDK